MRRQRHASPSPAQAASHGLEEDGQAKGGGQAGSNPGGSSHAWNLTQKKKEMSDSISPVFSVSVCSHRKHPGELCSFPSSQTAFVKVRGFLSLLQHYQS